MIGHLTVPVVDKMPASLSKRVITDLLRNELGFTGLVLTDALNMEALKGFGNASSECLKAGADILLHPADALETVKELLEAVKSGEISEEQIDKATERILKAKAKIQNIQRLEFDYQDNTALSSLITERSIVVVKKKAGLMPVYDFENACIFFGGDRNLYETSILKKYFQSCPESKPTDDAQLIIALFTSVAAWKGSSGIDDKEKKSIIELIGRAKKSIVISFGSPYVLCHLKEADTLIAAHEASHTAQMAVVKCLRGEIGFRGKMPVKLRKIGKFGYN